MSSPEYYRQEAARCRALAAERPASEIQKRWLRLAAEYEQLAQSLEGATPPAAQQARMQQQEAQQQTKTRGGN